jgi:hypothetical protein
VLANFATDFQQDRALMRQVVQQLVDAASKRMIRYGGQRRKPQSTAAARAAVETTGLVLQALLKSGEASDVARKALN